MLLVSDCSLRILWESVIMWRNLHISAKVHDPRWKLWYTSLNLVFDGNADSGSAEGGLLGPGGAVRAALLHWKTGGRCGGACCGC